MYVFHRLVSFLSYSSYFIVGALFLSSWKMGILTDFERRFRCFFNVQQTCCAKWSHLIFVLSFRLFYCNLEKY